MAHIEKFQASAGGAMMGHYTRSSEATLARENIDATRTHENYTLGMENGTAVELTFMPNWNSVQQRIEAVQEASGRKLRKDAVVLADVCVTLPQNVSEGLEKTFFKMTLEFLANRVGAQNIVAGYVHKDESRAHMHCAFTPIVGGDKFSFKQLCPRTFYQSLHKDLGDYLEAQLGFRPEIELPEEKRAQKELSRLNQSDYIEATRSLERLRQREGELAEQIAELQPTKATALESAAALAKGAGVEKRIGELEQRIEHRKERIESTRAAIEQRRGELSEAKESHASEIRELATKNDLFAKFNSGLERTLGDIREKLGVAARLWTSAISAIRQRLREFAETLPGDHFRPTIDRALTEKVPLQGVDKDFSEVMDMSQVHTSSQPIGKPTGETYYTRVSLEQAHLHLSVPTPEEIAESERARAESRALEAAYERIRPAKKKTPLEPVRYVNTDRGRSSSYGQQPPQQQSQRGNDRGFDIGL